MAATTSNGTVTGTTTTGSSSVVSVSGGSRDDKRSELQIRAPDVRAGVLIRADGSVKYSQGHTCVIVAINGPIPVQRKDEKMESGTLEVIMKPASGRSDLHIDIQKAETIRLALESMILLHHHPCTKIQIVIQVIRDDGALLATSLNACCLALLDSGLQCNSIITAVTIAAYYIDTPALTATSSGGSTTTKSNESSNRVRYVLDPLHSEENGADAIFTFAFSNTDASNTATVTAATTATPSTPSTTTTAASMVVSDTRGLMTDDIYLQSLDLARRTCATVEAFFRSAFEKTYIAS